MFSPCYDLRMNDRRWYPQPLGRADGTPGEKFLTAAASGGPGPAARLLAGSEHPVGAGRGGDGEAVRGGEAPVVERRPHG